MGDLIKIKNLVLSFSTEEGEVEALEGLDLAIQQGNIHGLIGETGCGKSVTGLTILQLLDENAKIKAGEIFYKDTDLLKMSEKQMERKIRGNEIAMIFQDPSSSLNPIFSIKNQMTEVIKMYKKAKKKDIEDLIIQELSKVKLPDVKNLLNRYPHQLSGGMKQRVMIAMMLACGPQLLIADEPTTALDVSIQIQFLKVIQELQKKLGMSILYITHDLAVVSEICDNISVMYAGRIVENLTVYELFENPIHPYTQKLVNSIPGVKTQLADLEEIPGSVPRLINPPSGCRFHPRCDEAIEVCSIEKPKLINVGTDHQVACHRR